MNHMKRMLPVLLLAVLLAACGGEEVPETAGDEMVRSTTDAPGEAVAELEDGVQVVRVEVGPMGYRPERIRLEAGVPARLIFHRTVESACAEQVQIPAYGIERTDLPMEQDVVFEFTPDETGEFVFTCGMDMLKGTLVVTS